MSINCRLNRNIALNGGTTDCRGVVEGVGGISSPVIVYNVDSIKSLKYKNDARADDTLEVDTINTTETFYKVECTSASYVENYSDNRWTHTLTVEIGAINQEFEDLIADASNGKFFVAFKPNGATDYRAFGWKKGARMTYVENISTDTLGYTLTFTYESEYPLLIVYADNIGNENTRYDPIPTVGKDDRYVCLYEDDSPTGEAVYAYVPVCNAAGLALDRNNHLCIWSGLPQVAYKYSAVTSDSGYEILDTYGEDATYGGVAVKFDNPICFDGVESILIDGEKRKTIKLNSTTTSSTFTITSTDNWELEGNGEISSVLPTQGEAGDTICSINHFFAGGTETLTFRNMVTDEVVTLDVEVNLIDVQSEFTYDYTSPNAMIHPNVVGCSSDFTYTISPEVTSSVDADGYVTITFPNDAENHTYTMTITHSCDENETKIVTITKQGEDSTPDWVFQTSYCEIAGSS